MPTLEIELQGSAKLKSSLIKLISSIDDWSSTLSVVGRTLTKFYSTVPFASQGGIYGARWSALTPKYASQKARKYPGRPILIASGGMSTSFKSEADSKKVRIFNTNRLFPFHQLGGGKLPQRVMMKLDRQRKEMLAQAIGTELKRKLERAI